MMLEQLIRKLNHGDAEFQREDETVEEFSDANKKAGSPRLFQD
jgi:hypothetical protein